MSLTNLFQADLLTTHHTVSRWIGTVDQAETRGLLTCFTLRQFDKQVKVTLLPSSGHYEWCPRCSDPGWHLTQPLAQRYERLVTMVIHLPPELQGVAQYYRLVFKKDIRYNVHPLLDSEVIIGTFLLPDEETKFVLYLGRYPSVGLPELQILHQQVCQVPTQLFNENCAICLDTVEPNKDIYLGSCGHLFHGQCLWFYIESKNKVAETCGKDCAHQARCLPFPCPVCRHLLEDSEARNVHM